MLKEFEEKPGRRNRQHYTLEAFVKHYFYTRKHELRPKTVELQSRAAKYLLAYFGKGRSIEKVTRANVRVFQTAMISNEIEVEGQRKTTLGKVTVNMYMRACRKMFSMAVDDELIMKNPFSKVIDSVDDTSEWRYITHQDFQRMIDVAPLHLRLLISLCRLAGLRKQEAENLEWSDIDFEGNRLYITAKDHWKPKTKSSIRKLPICPELQAVLLEAYEQAETGQQRVIQGSLENLDRDFKNLRKKAHVDQYKKPLHSLRKSCITDWAGRTPMYVVQCWAGHSKITTTEKYYSQVRESDYEKAVENRFFEAESTKNYTKQRKTTPESKAIEATQIPNTQGVK
jgi:integrase